MNGALDGFTAEVRRPDAELRLDRAALLIAAGEYHGLDIERYVALLDEIGARALALAPAGASPRGLAGAVREHLFHDLGFRGNEEDYYDARNSYLNEVLTRRTGIPISLAAVFLEVARRVGLDAAGVSYPRHFLVKYWDGGREWIVDPFHGGEEFPVEQLREHLVRRGTMPDRVLDYHLSAVTRRQMLTRMLTNLKMVYLAAEDYERALRIQEYMLAVNPWSFRDIHDRGMLRGRTGDIPGAVEDLETYLAHTDNAEDAVAVRRLVERLRAGHPFPQWM